MKPNKADAKKCPLMTLSSVHSVSDNQNSATVGLQGPVLLENYRNSLEVGRARQRLARFAGEPK